MHQVIKDKTKIGTNFNYLLILLAKYDTIDLDSMTPLTQTKESTTPLMLMPSAAKRQPHCWLSRFHHRTTLGFTHTSNSTYPEVRSSSGLEARPEIFNCYLLCTTYGCFY